MQQLHLVNVTYVSTQQPHFKALGHKFRPPKNTVFTKKIPNDTNSYFTLLTQQQ
jgi:hypothetical protein